MMENKPIKLLSKIALLFLVFTLVIFGVSTIVLTLRANNHIKKSVEKEFTTRKKNITKKLSLGEDPNRFNSATVIKLKSKPDKLEHIDTDSILVIDGSNSLYRIRNTFIETNGNYYKVTLRKSIDDFTNLKSDIANTIFPTLIILFVVIWCLSIFLSKYLLSPFHEILNQMKQYKIGENFFYQKVETTTSEFKTMQELYEILINKVERDYLNLKEYTENMSHELQTPLAIIRNKTENLIGDEDVMNNHSKSIKSIYDEANQLSKLGNTLKLLTKIENNEYFDKKIISTKEVIKNHVQKLEELAELKTIHITLDLYDNHTMNIDPYLLDIVLKNLIKNAILYSKEKAFIQINTTSSKFTISNYPMEDKPLSDIVFERFSKPNDSSSLGLGLAIVKKICELNDLELNYAYDIMHHFSISKSTNF